MTNPETSGDRTATALPLRDFGGLPAIAWLLLTALATAMVVFVVGNGINGNGDSQAIIRGTHWAAGCVGAGKFNGCGAEVTPYPLLQYIPSAIIMKLGAGDETILRWFGLISSFAFVATIGVMAATLRRAGRPTILAAGLLVLIASPLPWYAWSTFGESLGALACLCFVAAAALRLHPAALGISLVIAGQTKETALPFLFVLGVALLLWSTLVEHRARRSQWIALGVGSVVSIAGTGGFNQFRFGQLTNLVYADPIAHVPSLDLKVKYAISIWGAPNAGVITFWPAIFLVLLAMLAIMFRSRRPSPERWRLLGGGAAVLLVLAGLTAGYASWYAPFGWITWGPRLMLLMLPAILLTVLALFGPELEKLIGSRARWAPALLAVAVLIAVLGVLPQIGILHRNEVMGGLFAPDQVCPYQAPIGDNPGYYYTCIFHWAWWKGWILPDAAAGAFESPVAVAMALLWVTVIVALGVIARRAGLARREDPVDTAPEPEPVA